jgi:hypothetical protein
MMSQRLHLHAFVVVADAPSEPGVVLSATMFTSGEPYLNFFDCHLSSVAKLVPA